jgi:hypothetical protein
LTLSIKTHTKADILASTPMLFFRTNINMKKKNSPDIFIISSFPAEEKKKQLLKLQMKNMYYL